MSRLFSLLCLMAIIMHNVRAVPVAREWDWRYWLHACPNPSNSNDPFQMSFKIVHRRSLIVPPHTALLDEAMRKRTVGQPNALLWSTRGLHQRPDNDDSTTSIDISAGNTREKTKDLLAAVGEYAGSAQRMAHVLKAERMLGVGTPEDQLKNFEWESLPVVPGPSPAEFIQVAASDPISGATDLSQNIATVVQYTYHMLQSLAAHLSQSQQDQQARRDVNVAQLEMFERLNFGQDGMRALLCALRMVMNEMSVGPDTATEEQLRQRGIASLNDRNLLAVRDVLILKRLHDATEFTKKLTDLILQPSMWSTFISGTSARRAALAGSG